MTLQEAWAVLGRDLRRVKASIRGVSPDKRAEVADRALAVAKKAAQKIMIANHPDRHKGPEAEAAFKRANEAIRVVELHTEEFKRKLQEAPPDRRAGFIVVGGK